MPPGFDHRELARDQQLRLLVEFARPLVARIDGLLDGARRKTVADPCDRSDTCFAPAIAKLLMEVVDRQARGDGHQSGRGNFALFACQSADQLDLAADEPS